MRLERGNAQRRRRSDEPGVGGRLERAELGKLIRRAGAQAHPHNCPAQLVRREGPRALGDSARGQTRRCSASVKTHAAPGRMKRGGAKLGTACPACRGSVASSGLAWLGLAVQPTEWALSGGRERYGALGLSTLPRPSGAVTHCAWLSTGGHGFPIAKCVTVSGQEPRGWVAERCQRAARGFQGSGVTARSPIGGCTYANGSSPARLKISWPPLFSARGREGGRRTRRALLFTLRA